MTYSRRVRIWIAGMIAAAILMPAARVQAQSGANAWGEPTNNLPNPYRTISDWAKLSEGRAWGATAGVAIDRNGDIWVAERCGATYPNGCADSHLAPILKFDSSGKLLTSFGADLFVFPHGIAVDNDGSVWVTDGQGREGRGHQVFKFSPEGKILMTLGKRGVGGDGPDEFNMPSAVAIAPNGDIFVADGHGGNSNARIVKFSKDGKFLMTWGQRGAGPGDLNGPHCLAFDSQGRLFVCDRSNNRIQIFDQQGHSLALWTQFSRPSAIAIDKNDIMYVADSESGSVAPEHGAWKRGIRIGSAKDGLVTAFIPDPNSDPNYRGTSAAEGVAVDEHGVVYGAEVGQKDLKKYVKQQGQ